MTRDGLTVHHFLPNLAAGDAIGHHVRHVQRALAQAGVDGEIFYEEAQAAVRSAGRDYRTFDRERDGRGGEAWILYHLSTGSPMAQMVMETGLPFGVNYHNITPAAFFDRWEPGAAENLRRARADILRLAPHAAFAIGDSEYNEAEVAEAGFEPTATSPIVIDLSEYEAAPNERLLNRLRRENAAGGARWVFVGRVAPNKCQHDVIAAFAAYVELFDPAARLMIVGGRSSNVYYRSLELLADDLGVGAQVELTDTISFPEVLACYAASDVTVCLSEHEGYWLPAIEAMHLGVPVVAYAATAVPGTVGPAGVLLDSKDPVVVACAVHRVLSDRDLHEELIAAGRARAAERDRPATGPAFAATLTDLIDKARLGG